MAYKNMDDKTFVLSVYPHATLTRERDGHWYLRLVPGADDAPVFVFNRLMSERDCWHPARTYIEGQQVAAAGA